MMGFFDFNTGASLLLKLAGSIAATFYIVFAFVIVKQVGKMTETLEVGLEGIIRAISLLHLIFAIMALIAVLSIL